MKPQDFIEERQRWHTYVQKVETESNQENELANIIREKVKRGEIVDEHLQKWLSKEIASARVTLAVCMICTLLFDGQVIIWVILYIVYGCRVKKVKKQAIDRNMKDYGRYLK